MGLRSRWPANPNHGPLTGDPVELAVLSWCLAWCVRSLFTKIKQMSGDLTQYFYMPSDIAQPIMTLIADSTWNAFEYIESFGKGYGNIAEIGSPAAIELSTHDHPMTEELDYSEVLQSL
jgi:hypothetical protein